MTNNYDEDDLARLQALEHLVASMALMWSFNTAQLCSKKPSAVVAEV